MFNLDKAIKKWKRSLYRFREFEDGHIEELESHLRDEIDCQIQNGVTERDAFGKAVESLGTGKVLKKDFGPFGSGSLLLNYFRVGIRSLQKNSGYTFINIMGLSVGLVCFLVIGLMVKWQYSYDNFFKNSDRMYRVYDKRIQNGKVYNVGAVTLPFAPVVVKEVPEIEMALRVVKSFALFDSNRKKFRESFFYVDENFFDFMGFKLKSGTGNLKEPDSMVISEAYAKKYFGNQNPLGKVLKIDGRRVFRVEGVMSDIPLNSHFRTDILLPFKAYGGKKDQWGATGNDYTYVMLKPGASRVVVEERFKSIVKKNISGNEHTRNEFKLLPFSEIYWINLGHDFVRGVNRKFINIFGLVGVMILLIACINYVNLATAKSVGRTKEVGLRKVVGAQRLQLIRQFLVESMLVSFGALFVALTLAALIIPWVKSVAPINIEYSQLFELPVFATLLGISVLVGVLAGIYPAVVLSSFSPARNFRKGDGNQKGGALRGTLVTGQFLLSVFLIISIIVVYRQVDFLKKKDLGFKAENVMVIRTGKDNVKKNIETFKRKLLKNPSVINVTLSNGTPGSGNTSTSNYTVEGNEEDIFLRSLTVDEDFFEVYGIPILKGRNFDESMISDSQEACIINETALVKAGWKDGIGKKIQISDKPMYVIGVIRDFHYGSLKKKVWPSIYTIGGKAGRKSFLTVRHRGGDDKSFLKFVEKTYNSFSPNYPLRTYFVRDKMESYMSYESSVLKFLGVATGIALFISCLGIYGLISFNVVQKSREIGVRKVLGASTSKIFLQLLKGFGLWIGVANIMAWFLGYYAMELWLKNYAYRIDIDLWVFVGASLFSIAVAVSATGFKAFRGASINPVEALKYE